MDEVFTLELLHSRRVQMIGDLIEERPYLSEFVAEIEHALDKCESLTQLSLNVHVLKDNPHKFLSNRRSINSMVQMLPYKVPDLVFETFQTLPEWGRKALGWILHAQRPMNVHELAIAIALIDHKEAIKLDEDDRLLDLRTELYSAFGPLVKFENNQARFCHEQVRYCFQQAVKDEQEPKKHDANKETQSQDGKKQKIPLVSDWDITRILLKYLRSDQVLAPTRKALREEYWERPRGPIFDLMGYAVQFWPEHYRKARQHGSHAKEMLDLLQHRDLVEVWFELNSRFGKTFAPANMCVMDPFCLGALLGFVDLVEFYLTQKTSKGIILEQHSLALHLASWAGHLGVVTTFLDNDLWNASEPLPKALHYASSQEHEEIVELLMDKLSKPNHIVAWDPSFLCEAAELGNAAIVRKFIAAGANVDATHEGITPLQLAARNGHESIISTLLFQGADPNSLSAQIPDKAIHLAASKGYTAMVEYLLESQVDICVIDKDERTALHLASQNGHQQIVKLLIEQLPDVVAKAKDKNRQTALHLASLNGHTEVVKLIAQGIKDLDMDTRDDLGRTPLILASQNGHLPVVQLLLDKGATTNLTDNEDDSGHTALYYATLNGHQAIAEKILQVTTEALMTGITEILIQAAKQGFTSVCELCLSKFSRMDLHSMDSDDYSALHCAAENGHVEIVSLLIKHGAMVDLETDQIGTPLALAASAGRGQVVRVLLAADAKADNNTLVSVVAENLDDTDGQVDAVRALLEVGLDVNEEDDDGYSALHFAALNGSVKVAKTLLKYGANPSLQNVTSWTPLYLAASKDRREIVQLFIDHGVDLPNFDENGWTSMHIAAKYSCVSVMEILWEAAPALLTCRSKDGKTPLHVASSISETGPTEWLLAHSVDVDAVDKGGQTALMMSVEYGRDANVGLLLSHNANVRLRDNRQQTALHFAATDGGKGPAQRILEKEINIINWQDDCGFSALHTAIRNKKPDVVSTLLEQMPHIDINLKDKSGDTPLLLAVRNRLNDVVKNLLRCGAETAPRNNKSQTALLLAIEKKAKSIWMTLLQGADQVNVNEGGGAVPTALHMAAKDGQLDVVQQLLKSGADVNAKGGLYNTALQAAAAGGFVDVVEYLLMKGADASLGGGLFANALSAAVFSGTTEIMESLYEHKADINAQDDQGRTALHLAAWRGSMEMIEWLTDRKGDLSLKDHQGRTVVHHAAMAGNVDVVEMLMQDEKWPMLNVEDVDGWTPSHWACRNTDKEMIKLLNGGETLSNKETRYGWASENIARFYGALDLAGLAVKETTGNEKSAEPVEKASQQPKGKKRTWKSGFSSALYACDGCLRYVSLTL